MSGKTKGRIIISLQELTKDWTEEGFKKFWKYAKKNDK